MNPYTLLKDFLFNRYTIKVDISSDRVPTSNIKISITNQTPSIPVFVREVRVHYGKPGLKNRSRALILVPHECKELRPKEMLSWRLSRSDEEVMLKNRSWSKTVNSEEKIPQSSIASPRQLLAAIQNGGRKDSWVEVDFNEYKYRRFLRGKLKPLFQYLKLGSPDTKI